MPRDAGSAGAGLAAADGVAAGFRRRGQGLAMSRPPAPRRRTGRLPPGPASAVPTRFAAVGGVAGAGAGDGQEQRCGGQGGAVGRHRRRRRFLVRGGRPVSCAALAFPPPRPRWRAAEAWAGQGGGRSASAGMSAGGSAGPAGAAAGPVSIAAGSVVVARSRRRRGQGCGDYRGISDGCPGRGLRGSTRLGWRGRRFRHRSMPGFDGATAAASSPACGSTGEAVRPNARRRTRARR